MAVAYISWATLTIPAHVAGAISASVDEGGNVAITATATAVSTRLGSVGESASATETPSASITSGAALRAYVSWARLTLPQPRPAIAAAVAESLTATATTSATGGSVFATVAEIAAAIATQSASGGSVTVILPETLAATDISSAFTAKRVYLAFSDLVVPSPILTASVAESMTPVDTPSSTATHIATRSEVLVALDTSSNSMIAGGATVAEVAAATDAPNAVGGATPAAISESMAAIDTINGVGGVTILVQAETLSASDHPDAAALRPAAVSESVNAIATTDAVASAQINESLTVLDACSAILITEGSIAENTASAQDTVAAATLWEVFVAEAAAPADHPDFFVFFPPVFMDESPGSMARGAQIGGRLGIPAPAGTTTEGKID